MQRFITIKELLNFQLSSKVTNRCEFCGLLFYITILMFILSSVWAALCCLLFRRKVYEIYNNSLLRAK